MIPLGNFIKIERKILKWEWWSDINTFRLFFYMLVSAYWKDGNYKGVEIKRGSFPSSISELSRETNLSTMEIRTALKHLQSTGEVTTNQQATNKQDNTNLTSNLTSKKTNKFTVFTVVNYDLYQSDNKQDNTNLTSNLTENQQASNTQLNKQITGSILKEYKNDKNVNKKIYTCAFEDFWKAYPRKKDKGNAFKKFNARLNSGFSEVELIEAAKNYADECQQNRTETKYIKHPATFLSDSTPFVDYLKGGDCDGRAGRNDKTIQVRDEYAEEFERLLSE